MPPLIDHPTGGDAYAYERRVKDDDFTATVNSDFRAKWLPLGDFRPTRERPDTPASHFTFDVDTTRHATPIGADFTQSSPGPVPEERHSLPERGSEHEAAVRLELLVRKSVANLSAEEDARLKVATERLRKLLPRVTAADFEALVDVAEKIEATGREATALRRELGLDD